MNSSSWKALIRFLAALLIALPLSPWIDQANAVDTPTYTGVAVATGSDQTWVTLLGANLSHDPANVRLSGYQTVYYKNASSGGWIAFASGDVRNNPDDSATIQVFIPSGIQTFLFHIDTCDDWNAITGCVAWEVNSSTYTVVTSTVTLHYSNGISDSTTIVNFNTVFQLPKVSETANLVFRSWNSLANGSGTSYSPFTNITVTGKKEFYAQWISKGAAQISLYMDAPFVQASYATGPKVKTETFDTLTVGINSCGGTVGSPGQLNVGSVVGNCTIDNVGALSASTTLSDPFFGGVGSNYATDYPAPSVYKVNFGDNQKYVGFWWAAGSPGNYVEFLSGSSVVAEINVNQLFGVFGGIPADYAGATDSVQSLDGNTYPKKYYYGNPNGYASIIPTSPSSVAYDEPYVYIHAFATNGAYFDGIRFSGAGFEIDNLTISRSSVPVNPRLVYVQGIEAQNLDPNQEIYFVTYDSNTSDSGSVPIDVNSPYAPGDSATALSNSGSLTKAGFTFNGWNTKSDGLGIAFNPGDSITVNSDVQMFAQWISIPTNGNPPSNNSQTNLLVAPKYPGIIWNPTDLKLGEAISAKNQLNAEFSVAGGVTYSVEAGLVPKAGEFIITLSFKPTDTLNYYAISTSRTIQVRTPSVAPEPAPQETSEDIQVPQTVTSKSLKLISKIQFNNNEYFLDASDRKAIIAAANKLNLSGQNQVIVQGNTDIKRGVDNVWLSRARAEAVANLFSKYSKSRNIIKAWYASTRPIAIGLDPASLAINRRVEILISSSTAAEKIDTSIPTSIPVSRTFKAISFNKDEYFLDAEDRKQLVSIAKSMVGLGCTKISLTGTHDNKPGGLNDQIALLRANAVKVFLRDIAGSLSFSSLLQELSQSREVHISCTN
ncbi:unannotated protein [freshwater metagenome]|uniref:Unannotated protein n=1 Tax=freshwater metagenome TaxID=449393 RepID=A0A6J6S638_9ZZZZ|nr:OmpA family protein [Actinomycetota bacterium]MSY82976.1 OmpA family protein [Actinomycetota bacterium]MSZ46110.1 OmpA family protein [Actinomycetota bacterium]MTA04783.1 OmpA family protein [Actinomycetota bacterium]